ncbi:oocyte zinc finger protein XlCOF6-like [Cheilinus undulatus]|uniref:oocyte zinc finger protein XlCOF6-like n=1 Tax=Cheilinus undulatus TaxID=241271 RepID=UPI001BD41CA8|nr:oocyte zinc finger protein XlCOF6-like [Cheilinus undulatus]
MFEKFTSVLTAEYVKFNCVSMSKVETLKVFVNQRLSAAADEIFELFERTIAEYEEQLRRSKEENRHKQTRLDAVSNPQRHRADIQQLTVHQEEVLPEQQEWRPSLDQEGTEPPHIKEEEEELWSSQGGLEGGYSIKFPFAPVSVKSEDDEEKPQISQLHEIQTEEIETGSDGEDCEGAEHARNSEQESDLQPETEYKIEDSSEAETDVSDDWSEADKHQSGLDSSEDFDNTSSDIEKKSNSCSVCGKTFEHKHKLIKHMTIHRGEKPFSCSQCGKKFGHKGHFTRHMLIHSKEKLFSCPDCGKRFKRKSCLTRHMFLHTEEKPFSCSECGKTFKLKSNLTSHMLVHNGEKLFNCSECDKSFKQKSCLNRHMFLHTGEKPFSCSVCGVRFNQKGNLTSHMLVHTEEKSFSCTECDKRFNKKANLTSHLLVHAGEKPFSCSECDKKFQDKSYLTKHLAYHRGEKPLSCRLCGQRFSWHVQLRRHMFVCGQSSCGLLSFLINPAAVGELPPEQRDRSPGLDQPPHIKEEEEELRNCQKGLEELNTTKFPFTPVLVKSEDEEEKPQISQVHQTQTGEVEPGAGGEDCEGVEQARNSDTERHLHSETEDKDEDSSEAETDDSEDWRDTAEYQSGLDSLEKINDSRSNTDKRLHSCPECGGT